MNKRAVTAVLGLLLLVFAAFMAVPLLMALRTDLASPDARGLGAGCGLCLAVGAALYFGFRRHFSAEALGVREGLAVTTLGWIVLTGFGAAPFCIAHDLSFTNAYFEVMSGLTTTGSTILTAEQIDEGNAESIGRALMFWRSMTHWIGGMGIILLVVAILPLFGAGGYQLFRAEVPGPTKDRLKPRIVETAKTLWLIYVGLSALETVLLWLAGMTMYDALCHSFATMATGGLSTHSQSVGFFSMDPATTPGALGPGRGLLVEAIIDVFMFLAGCNFVLLYRAALGRSVSGLWRSSEFRLYLYVTVASIAVMTVLLYTQTPTPEAIDVYGEGAKTYGFGASLRAAAFNTISILTTTGFGTEDFHVWPSATRVLLLLLMAVGGCAGSTGGGMKQVRVLLLAKFAWRELVKVVRPRAVLLVKFEGRAVAPDVLGSLLGFFVPYMGALAAGSMAMTLILEFWGTPMRGAAGPNGILLTAFSSCLATLSNIGPGMAGVGPVEHYGPIPALGKWLLSLLMLMGRLEVFTVLALLAPGTWRK
ncbi:MAG: TrkH family potassium uptake protein [Planctomycetes bacterium]|nr:TrkH family potassium uptake protein [Planctomycetota bacterium]